MGNAAGTLLDGDPISAATIGVVCEALRRAGKAGRVTILVDAGDRSFQLSCHGLDADELKRLAAAAATRPISDKPR